MAFLSSIHSLLRFERREEPQAVNSLIVKDFEDIRSNLIEPSLDTVSEIGLSHEFLQESDAGGCQYAKIASSQGGNSYFFKIKRIRDKLLPSETLLTTKDQQDLLRVKVGDKIPLNERFRFIHDLKETEHFLRNPSLKFTIVETSNYFGSINCSDLLNEVKNIKCLINSGQRLNLREYVVIGNTAKGMPYKIDFRYLDPSFGKNQKDISCTFELSEELKAKKITLIHPKLPINSPKEVEQTAFPLDLAELPPKISRKSPPVHKIRTLEEFIGDSPLNEPPLEVVLPKKITCDFEELGVAGLNEQATIIMRETFLLRMLPRELRDAYGAETTRGFLLWGAPGTGKTKLAAALAKKFAESGGGGKKIVTKLIHGPEVFNKWVGGSEKNIREPFDNAKAHKDEFHIIIFDEIDSVAAKRTGGGGNENSVVGQLLTMIDGVDDSYDNFLIIGITNRKDVIDEALLRTGRLGRHIFVGLPDKKGRESIFKVHTRSIKNDGLLAEDVDFEKLSALTDNYTGAEIEDIVLKAKSSTDRRNQFTDEKGNIHLSNANEIELKKITQEDLLEACKEVIPAHGISGRALQPYLEASYQVPNDEVADIIREFENRVRFLPHRSEPRPLCWSIYGGRDTNAAGLDKKTQLAVHLARTSQAPIVMMVSFHEMKGLTAIGRCNYLKDIYENAKISPFSVIILEDIPLLAGMISDKLQYDHRKVIQTLKNMLESPLPEGKQMIFIGTVNERSGEPLDLYSEFPPFLSDMGLQDSFDKTVYGYGL